VEEKLVYRFLQLEQHVFDVTVNYLQCLAFHFTELNHLSHRFNKDKKIAVRKWYCGFIRQHPQPSLRQPQATSLARAQGFNRERVNEFVYLLEWIVEDKNPDATRICDVDETGLTIVQKKPRRVVSMKGRSKICSVSSGERGVNTTAICCVSAAGCYVPPMLIYK
jgi:hypothetical protein